MHYHDGYEILFFEQARALFRADITICDIADATMLSSVPIRCIPRTGFWRSLQALLCQCRLGNTEQFARRMGMASRGSAQRAALYPFSCRTEPALLRRARTVRVDMGAGRRQARSLAGTDAGRARAAALGSCRQRRPGQLVPRAGRENLHFSRMLAYIDQHLREGVALRDLEEEFFLSRHYICRLFRQHTGLTVSQYVNRKKVILAQQLLIDPSATVTDACWFRICAYTVFSKVFKKSPV